MHLAPERLSPQGRAALAARHNELFLSSASVWEIVVKHKLGKLRLPLPPERYVPDRVARARTMPLSIDHRHALRLSQLPLHHRDPFDRMLVAQAQVEQLPILTADRQLAAYEVHLLPA